MKPLFVYSGVEKRVVTLKLIPLEEREFILVNGKRPNAKGALTLSMHMWWTLENTPTRLRIFLVTV